MPARQENADPRVCYALHVKPRTEKKVDSHLKAAGRLHYLPVWVKVAKIQRRKVRTELPLFPGYVFAYLDSVERRDVLTTNNIVRTIPVRNPRELVHQLRQIRHAGRLASDLRPAALFKEGDLVRVKYGPLMGFEGYMKREGPRATIVLNLDILGQAVETAVSPLDCETVEV